MSSTNDGYIHFFEIVVNQSTSSCRSSSNTLLRTESITDETLDLAESTSSLSHTADLTKSKTNVSTSHLKIAESSLHSLQAETVVDPVVQQKRENIVRNIISWTKKKTRGIYEQVRCNLKH